MSLRPKYVPFVVVLLLLAPAVLLAAESEAGAALDAARTCSGGECAGAGWGLEEEAMPTESSRRALAAAATTKKYVSYDALMKDRVPCSQRGQSYYNCQNHGKANPYRRGCTVITRCARMLN